MLNAGRNLSTVLLLFARNQGKVAKDIVYTSHLRPLSKTALSPIEEWAPKGRRGQPIARLRYLLEN
jgi:hypothetical protein